MSTRYSAAVRTFLAALVIASGACALRTPADLLTPAQVRTVVERSLPGVTAVDATLDSSGQPVRFVVRGSRDGDPLEAEVGARSGRILATREAGSEERRPVLVVAHRGLAREAPENTLAAIEKAIERGADAIEIDVRGTKDGHFVLMHDAGVDNTTDGTGRVSELTLAEIQALDAGSWFGDGAEFAGERVPTLAEALDAMEGRALPDIDFKGGDAEALVAMLRERGLLDKATIATEYKTQMRDIVAAAPEARVRPTLLLGPADLPGTIESWDPPVLNVIWRGFRPQLIQNIHLEGRLAFFTTLGKRDNEEGMILAIESGADYIQTDNVETLLRLLRARGLHD